MYSCISSSNKLQSVINDLLHSICIGTPMFASPKHCKEEGWIVKRRDGKWSQVEAYIIFPLQSTQNVSTTKVSLPKTDTFIIYCRCWRIRPSNEFLYVSHMLVARHSILHFQHYTPVRVKVRTKTSWFWSTGEHSLKSNIRTLWTLMSSYISLKCWRYDIWSAHLPWQEQRQWPDGFGFEALENTLNIPNRISELFKL